MWVNKEGRREWTREWEDFHGKYYGKDMMMMRNGEFLSSYDFSLSFFWHVPCTFSTSSLPHHISSHPAENCHIILVTKSLYSHFDKGGGGGGDDNYIFLHIRKAWLTITTSA